MTFNENAQIDTSGITQRSGGGRTGAAVGGGSILFAIVAFVIAQVTGVDISGLVGGGQQSSQSETVDQKQGGFSCSGQDANRDVNCRMAGAQNSLDDFWRAESPKHGFRYETPGFVLYRGQTQSACGTASNSVGPFYCPNDNSMYVEPTFFKLLEQQFGAKDGPTAELYVVGHEWGHHIQTLNGTIQQINQRDTGPTSDSVKLELQADCFAGVWLQHASETKDKNGTALLKPLTDAEIKNALGAAAGVGDDHIQETAGRGVNPEGFTHGTSEQRQRWFTAGYRGSFEQCDTFSAPRL